MREEHLAVIGLGASLGDRLGTLRMAVRHLQVDPALKLRGLSRVYRTPALGPAVGPFLNAAVAVLTTAEPRELLELCKAIEARLGRRPARPWADRAVDLDILIYEGVVLAEESLCLPHAGLGLRDFAWVPAVEVAPGLVHPVLGRPMASLAGPPSRGMVRTTHMLGSLGPAGLAPSPSPQ